MTKRNKIQELIFGLLGQKKTTSLDDLVDHIEGILEEDAERSTKAKYAITRTLKNLAARGEIENHDATHSSFVRLTNEGRQRMNTMKLDADSFPIPSTWDGKWRIVILNLPEDQKEQRNALRYLLKKANFVSAKNSVWISPYPFEHFFENMKKDMGLTCEMMILVSGELDEGTMKYFSECYLEG
jgi:phenylacetic acid degradation operon negative regulatory protein